ncbi:MAG: transcription elongation factor GreB [Halobacteriovoraceae bacterium]|nr:transcription elongation factor GreB [Halobacteriovoraceae bacterium]|tara:strand:- start:32168 stop:32629 length:462 start_codon:yes stop_codon:yes gene_type:complete
MTPQCHQKLSDEYDRLRNIERPEITKVIQWAAGNGDRSENADYIYGKKRLREIDSRLRFLGKRLGDAVVVNPETIESETIKFGATVTVIENDLEKVYYIVGQDEIDLSLSKISWKSPIGKSLLGKEEGDLVELNTPNGNKELEIVSVSYKAIP